MASQIPQDLLWIKGLEASAFQGLAPIDQGRAPRLAGRDRRRALKALMPIGVALSLFLVLALV